MNAWIKYAELERGDHFIVDLFYTGEIGEVVSVSEPQGQPACVEVVYYSFAERRRMGQLYNAEHITKYLRPGERNLKINLGRG